MPGLTCSSVNSQCRNFQPMQERSAPGVTADMKLLTLIGEVTEPGRRNVYRRPDGSLTHW